MQHGKFQVFKEGRAVKYALLLHSALLLHGNQPAVNHRTLNLVMGKLYSIYNR